MIKYIGSKRALLAEIVRAISGVLPDGGTVCDLFSGSARVGHALKKQGFRVWSNDHNAYAHVLATAYVQADRERWLEKAGAVLAELRAVTPEAGWFTKTFCEDARYFTPENGAVIDAMRDRIAALALEPELEAIALVSLMEAADRVDSTAGLQMAYMKQWAARALPENRSHTVPPSGSRPRIAEAIWVSKARLEPMYLIMSLRALLPSGEKVARGARRMRGIAASPPLSDSQCSSRAPSSERLRRPPSPPRGEGLSASSSPEHGPVAADSQPPARRRAFPPGSGCAGPARPSRIRRRC